MVSYCNHNGSTIVTSQGNGQLKGQPEGQPEGELEGELEGQPEGQPEGQLEGQIEGQQEICGGHQRVGYARDSNKNILGAR